MGFDSHRFSVSVVLARLLNLQQLALALSHGPHFLGSSLPPSNPVVPVTDVGHQGGHGRPTDLARVVPLVGCLFGFWNQGISYPRPRSMS